MNYPGYCPLLDRNEYYRSICRPGIMMHSFRYRTKTLLGPWRESSEAAVQDAIRAKQARPDDKGNGWHWVIDGMIEEREEASRDYLRNEAFDFSPPMRRSA